MSTTETALQSALKTLIQSLDEFDAVDVAINEWTILDGPNINAPYVVIKNADDLTARKDTAATQNQWLIPVELYVNFTDWKETLDRFRNMRQALLTLFGGDNDSRSADSIEGVTIDVIRNRGPIEYLYDRYLPDDLQSEALPIFISQTLIFECQEF
jgi:hypothetical protein